MRVLLATAALGLLCQLFRQPLYTILHTLARQCVAGADVPRPAMQNELIRTTAHELTLTQGNTDLSNSSSSSSSMHSTAVYALGRSICGEGITQVNISGTCTERTGTKQLQPATATRAPTLFAKNRMGNCLSLRCLWSNMFSSSSCTTHIRTLSVESMTQMIAVATRDQESDCGRKQQHALTLRTYHLRPHNIAPRDCGTCSVRTCRNM